MIKSWADHCSSDEEDSVADEPHDDEDLATDAAAKLQVEEDDAAAAAAVVPVSPDEVVPRVYDFPTQPPFTAFVGNLSYSIKDSTMLADTVANLAKERLSEPVNVLGGRVAFNRTDPQGKHRGFGYVEVETLDQLKLLMTLNEDADAMIAGRKVQFDTANHQHNNNNNNNNNFNNNRRGSQGNRGSWRGAGGGDNRGPADDGNHATFGSVDGSKFRGGKHTNQNRNDDKRRGSSSNRGSFQSNTGGANKDPPKEDGPPPQRPSLKLAPRTKPVEASEPVSFSASNIFGGATARDEQAWQHRRASSKPKERAKEAIQRESPNESGDKDKPAPTEVAGKDRSGSRASDQFQEQRSSGRGRGGRGRGGRGTTGGGRHDKGEISYNRKGARRDSAKQPEKKQPKQQQSPEEKAAAAAAAAKVATVATVPQPEPKKTEASNKFALLMDSDSE